MKSLYALLALLVCYPVYLALKPDTDNELTQKPIYAALQAADIEHKDSTDSIIYISQTGYNIVGLNSENERRIWIITDSIRSENELYVLPENGATEVSCELVSALDPSRVAAAVLNVLTSLCRSES